jgi:hypothetical protein
MAEIIADEGLDYIISLLLRNSPAAPPATLYVGLFTGGTATTVPANAATLATMGGTFAEAAFTGYARQSVSAASWGALGVQSGGRGSVGPQVTFTASGASATAVNGFFLCTVASGTSGVTLGWSNFVEGAVTSLASGDAIKVTPTFALTG